MVYLDMKQGGKKWGGSEREKRGLQEERDREIYM